MRLTPRQMDQKIDEHFGYEAADDVNGVLATLTDDVEHDIVGWPGGPSFGREGARAFYDALFSDLAESRFTTVKRLYGDNFLVDESLWSGKAVGTPFGIEGNGCPLQFRLLHVIEFTEGGDIKRENVWIDLGAIQQQLQPAKTA